MASQAFPSKVAPIGQELFSRERYEFEPLAAVLTIARDEDTNRVPGIRAGHRQHSHESKGKVLGFDLRRPGLPTCGLGPLLILK